MTKKKQYTESLLFGVKAHDPDYWRDHPLVAESEVHIADGTHGYVEIKLNKALELVTTPGIAEFADKDTTQHDPDLYFWSEGECPVVFFELAPRLRKLLVFTEGPVADDDRDWWCAGLWLNPKTAT